MHTNLANGKRYVGITRQLPERRWQKGAGYANTLFGNAIAKYGWDSFVHEVLASGLTKSEACEMETRLIKTHRLREREYGYNISAGGETCDVIVPKCGIEHPNHQRVKMIDRETGEVLKIFDSQSDAARELGISRKGITKACVGKGTATYKGYRWEYADKDYERPENPGMGNYNHEKQKKSVMLIEPDGTVKTYKSVKEAAEQLGINRCNISRYVLGMRQDASGRRWCFV